MRQTVGGTWLLQLMILFILLFVGFIILTLNYSKTIKTKNEVLSIIEKYEGINDNSISLINNFLLSNSYGTLGSCDSKSGNYVGTYGARTLNGTLEQAQKGEKYFYCIKKYVGANTSNYYEVTLFYKFNLPVIGETSSFRIKGLTTNFQSNDANYYKESVNQGGKI